MKQEVLYQVALNMLPGIGSVMSKQLISYCGSVEEIFTASRNKLEKIPGIGPKTASIIKGNNLLRSAEADIEKCLHQNVDIIFCTDSEFPSKLKHAIDSPILLYRKGASKQKPERTLAIVGTRRATEYGKNITRQVVEELLPYNVRIISGLAYGIDITAHRAAVTNQVVTDAVLGSGIDIIYPALHKKTASDLTENGFLYSEYPLGTKPESYHFPARNRIIAGLSDAVLVIEAADRGGALITAEIAQSYNREIFALPGNLDLEFSRGCNKLIQEHKAMIFTGVKDLVMEMNWDSDEIQPQPKRFETESLSSDELVILELLNKNRHGIAIDQLAWKSQLTVNKLASVLLNLEFTGMIKALPGKKYRLKGQY